MFEKFEELTVEQLLHKQLEIKQKIAQAHGSGMSLAIINQMENMLDNVMIEYRSKVEKEAVKTKRDQRIEEGKDPDDDLLNIGSIE